MASEATAAAQNDRPHADARVAQLEQEVRALRGQLTTAYLTRDALGTMLHGLFKSWAWRASLPVRVVARLLGVARLGMDRLAPLTDARRAADGSWDGAGPGIFLVPTFPIRGWARVRAMVRASVASQCCLYFDTGRGFNRVERFPLATVSGLTHVDRLVPIRTTAFALRFDPVEHHGRYAVEAFSVEPQSKLTANLFAAAVNLRKMVMGPDKVEGQPQGHRPSVLIGLRLLLTGQWAVFHRQLVNNTDAAAEEPDVAVTDYDAWVKYHTVTAAAGAKMADEAARWPDPPTFSVLVPVYDVPEPYLRLCLDSVLKQVYPHWQLCVADDASPSPHVRAVLDEYAARDARVKVVHRPANGNIAAASNSALELATGTYVALLDHDDELAEHALYRMAQAIVADRSLDLVYSDEDKVSPDGERHDPFFKPDWSPEYFLACMYTCHLSVYRTELVRKVGGFRSEYDGAQDYDLVLRLLEAGPPKIGHVPDVLYHWRTLETSTAATADAKPDAHRRAQQAIQRYVTEGLGRAATVVDGPSAGFHHVDYAIVGRPRVSVVIPSACRQVNVDGQRGYMALRCCQSVRRLSTYADVEILVLDHHDMPPELEADLAALNVRRVAYDFDFNWSAVNDHGAAAATGDVLVFLNDDVEVISPDWVERMLAHAQWPDVGAVGAKLLFPDDTLQHAGVFLPGGNPTHPFYGFPGDHPGYYRSAQVHRNWVAVTGACMMVRKDAFVAAGGFDATFPLNYNDVEFCLRLHDRGLRVVYEPLAVLRHHESKTRKSVVRPAELAAVHAAWYARFRGDPFYNPNLTGQSSDFRMNALAAPTGDAMWVAPNAADAPAAVAAAADAPYTFDRDRWLAARQRLSSRFLAGDGIEVGALHQPLWTPPAARVRYVDRYDVDGLRHHYPELREVDLTPVDVLDDGERLDRFADDSLDFVICNHMLEHCENPLGTIRSHLRRVRPGGVLYYAVPDKRRTFDVDRDLTPFSHLVDDDRHGPDRSRRQHYREWATHVGHLAGDAAEAEADRLDRMNYSIHYHVWNDDTFRQFVQSARLYLGDPFAVEAVVQNEFETITVLRKRKAPAAAAG